MATLEAMLDGCFDEDWESSAVEGGRESSHVLRGYHTLVKGEQRVTVEVPFEEELQGLSLSKKEKETVEMQLLRVSIELTEIVREVAEFQNENHPVETEAEVEAWEHRLSDRYKRVRDSCARIAMGPRDKKELELFVENVQETHPIWELLIQVQEIGEEWREYCEEACSLTLEDVTLNLENMKRFSGEDGATREVHEDLITL